MPMHPARLLIPLLAPLLIPGKLRPIAQAMTGDSLDPRRPIPANAASSY